ncbi:MAG TPA: MFS transporter [Methylomirabilota bacterium]|jgi:MFS family permease|nr:MFS transporter [Methylomirabilota bacterium]
MPVLLAALGALLMSLDSAINIVLPAMAAAFGVAPAAIRWVIICYVVTYALTAFVAGVLADRLGPAPVFVAGLWLSGVTFLGYALAPAYGGVLLLRMAQGLGGGLVYGTAPALVTLSLPRERHGRGLGMMSLGLGVGLGIGPLVGGVLLEHFGWAASFLFRAPLFLAVAVLAQTQVRRLGGARPARRRVALADLLRLPVLRNALLAFLSNHAQFAVWLLVPFFLIGPLGLSPTVGGLVFALTPLANALVAPLGGVLTDRVGARGPLACGLALEAAGLLAIATLTAGTSLVLVGVAMALVGLGVGLFQVPNLAQMMASFPPAQQGVAGGLAFLSRTLGSAVGVQVTAALFDARVGRDGFLSAFHVAFLAAAAVCAVGAVLAVLPGGPARAAPVARPGP